MTRKRKKSDCRVRLNDEAPRIGSGVRGVQVLKTGRKWVRIRETSTGATARLALDVFQQARAAAEAAHR